MVLKGHIGTQKTQRGTKKTRIIVSTKNPNVS